MQCIPHFSLQVLKESGTGFGKPWFSMIHQNTMIHQVILCHMLHVLPIYLRLHMLIQYHNSLFCRHESLKVLQGLWFSDLHGLLIVFYPLYLHLRPSIKKRTLHLCRLSLMKGPKNLQICLL